VNEISDHLPVYSWGPYVQREFELAAAGYSLMSTMHAETVDGVIEQLREECDVPEGQIGHLALVVPMFVGTTGGRRVRRVSEVAVLEPLGGSYDRHSVARWEPASDSYDVLSTPAQMNALARRLGIADEALIHALATREALIESLLADDVTAIDDVQARVFAAAGYEVMEQEQASGGE
jgi:hypothetical protein